jgi:hypothetical protein
VSNRSRQAQRLARSLTSLADVLVGVIHEGGHQYLVQWGNGPTMSTMLEHVTEQLATRHYPDLSAPMVRYARGYSARAFAARAVASLRDGTLTSAIRVGVQERARLGISAPSWSQLSAEELTAHQHVEGLLAETSHPDRPNSPTDEPAIAALIRVSGGNEYTMLPTLLSSDFLPDLRAVPREAQAL